jgi:hypothetical protein
MKTIAHLFLLFAFASVGFPADTGQESQTDDIREAVFRWQFDHNASGQQTNAQIDFLQVGVKCGDPTDAFLKRFAENKPPVRMVSASNGSAGTGVFDKKTGEKGVIFRITSIVWKSDMEVEVKGVTTGGIDRVRKHLTVKKKGQWKVTHDKMEWISRAKVHCSQRRRATSVANGSAGPPASPSSVVSCSMRTIWTIYSSSRCR